MTAPDSGLAARVEGAIRAEREAVLDELGHDAVLWLALVPLWTKSAAQSVDFPAPDLADFIRRARAAGWCETRGSLRDGGAPGLRFWMPGQLRRDVLGSLRRHTGAAAAEIAARVLRGTTRGQGVYGSPGFGVTGYGSPGYGNVGFGNAGRQGPPTAFPAALEAWAGLVNSGAADRQLVAGVSQAVDRDDLGRATDLIAAGEALAALYGGTMDVAADRARRLLGLGRRRRMDAADLERYLDRPELSGAVDRLLSEEIVRPAGDVSRWALHLRGVGGVGKTMLVTYLASGRYFADRGRDPIPMARVDFDYMSPEYPVRRPVQLLLELADELALHTAAVGPADAALARFRATATSVHEALSGARPGASPAPTALRDERVLGAVDAFADVLTRLGLVLLILDTCEELAKFDAGDPAAPAVTATLRILERLHGRAPLVRVLFAGRRPLPGRGYLAVQPVGGFTAEEARRYLSSFPDALVGEDLAAEIIRQSPALDDPARISPFDLALYRSWAEEDPGLTAERVSRGSDAYIEGRIIERLAADEADVLRSLPALATAGRCRVATLAAFLDADPGPLGRRLAAQEWIDAERAGAEHVAAKPALARRLRRYFAAPDRAAAFEAETTRLAALLRARIGDAPVADVDRDEVLAALRLSAPAEAADLWDALAERAKNSREWDWLRTVAERARGEWEEEEWPTTRALRATVIAAQIAATRRANPSFKPRAFWTEVRRSWRDHPDAEMGRVLAARADAARGPSAWPADLIENPEVAAACVDAAHRLLENRDAAAASYSYRLSPKRSLPSAAIEAWARIALARLKIGTDLARARLWSLDAERAASLAARETAAEYFDWIQPDDLLARVRLEGGLIAPPDDDKLTEWESYAEAHFDTIDAERLASLCLRTRLSRGVLDGSVIERWERIDRYEHGWQPVCSAHEAISPLFATLAAAWLAAGDPQRALDLLNRRREAALATRADETTIRHADAGTLRVATRLHLEDQFALITRLIHGRDRKDARFASAVVLGEMPAGLEAEITRTPEPGIPVTSTPSWRGNASRCPYESWDDLPVRLRAETAFDAAELALAADDRERAARWYVLAREAYFDCDDRIGLALAAAACADITGEPPEHDALALVMLNRANPDVWRALTGDPGQAGPWRYWAAVIQRSAPPKARSWLTLRGGLRYQVTKYRILESWHLWLALLFRFLERAARGLAGDVGVAVYVEGDRPEGGGIRMRRLGLFSDRDYHGRWERKPDDSIAVTWEPGEFPDLSRRWPRRGVRRGTLRVTGPVDTPAATVPWERVLAGPGIAPIAWHRGGALLRRYAVAGPVRHVVGRAIDTPAGPRLDAGADPDTAAPRLLGYAELGDGNPSLIVLQSVPVAEEAEALAGDDLPEKLALANDLILDRSVPAVLIVPAVPATLDGEVRKAITRHERRRRTDPHRLLVRLRKILAPYVSPTLLNDLVLIVED